MTRVLLLWSLIVTCQALEVIGEPAYLTTTTTPMWRHVRLGEVLDEVGKLAGCPVKRDEKLADAELDQQVTLVLPGQQPLRRVLTLLEQAQDLHITVTVDHLTITTLAQWNFASRREIRFDLRDYGALIAFPEPEPGAERKVPRVLNPNPVVLPRIWPTYTPDAEAVVEYLEYHLRGDQERPPLRLEDEHLLVAMVNPLEEAAMRHDLNRLVTLFIRTTTWSTTFGLLPNGQPLVPGIITRDAADALRKRLKIVKQLSLQSYEQRPSRVAAQQQQELVTELSRLPNELLPIAEVLTTGWSCELRPIDGWNSHRLTYQLSWSEARPLTTATIVVPPAADAPAASPGQTLTLVKPAVWSWEPAGDVFLPPAHVLVLVAPHDNGRAVILVEGGP